LTGSNTGLSVESRNPALALRSRQPGTHRLLLERAPLTKNGRPKGNRLTPLCRQSRTGSQTARKQLIAHVRSLVVPPAKEATVKRSPELARVLLGHSSGLRITMV